MPPSRRKEDLFESPAFDRLLIEFIRQHVDPSRDAREAPTANRQEHDVFHLRFTLGTPLRDIEDQVIDLVMARLDGNRAAAAEALGLAASVLARKLDAPFPSMLEDPVIARRLQFAKRMKKEQRRLNRAKTKETKR